MLPGVLIRNAGLKFVCKPVGLTVAETQSDFTRNYEAGQRVEFPVAHGEGNYYADDDTLDRLEGEDRVVFRYAPGENPNGSARDIAGIITQIRKEKIPAVFLENISDPRLIRRIAAETGARVGGTLYSDSLTGEKGAAPTYIELVRHNIKALTGALAD